MVIYIIYIYTFAIHLLPFLSRLSAICGSSVEAVRGEHSSVKVCMCEDGTRRGGERPRAAARPPAVFGVADGVASPGDIRVVGILILFQSIARTASQLVDPDIEGWDPEAGVQCCVGRAGVIVPAPMHPEERT